MELGSVRLLIFFALLCSLLSLFSFVFAACSAYKGQSICSCPWASGGMNTGFFWGCIGRERRCGVAPVLSVCLVFFFGPFVRTFHDAWPAEMPCEISESGLAFHKNKAAMSNVYQNCVFDTDRDCNSHNIMCPPSTDNDLQLVHAHPGVVKVAHPPGETSAARRLQPKPGNSRV
jgi:hypothetical protein